MIGIRIITSVVGLILAGSFAVPASPALAAGQGGPAQTTVNVLQDPPADCTVNVITERLVELTCTDRPVGQQWHVFAWCVTFGHASRAVGNVVTGNGTSAGVCDPDFGIISEENVYFVED